MSSLLPQVRRAVLLHDDGGMTDGRLLECFITRRDEAAFEALVRRHGPMVLGVCRRMLRHSQDVEDAFQATFLVLIRKAAAIGQRELLGNWLYGVAYRTALDARAASSRRLARERQMQPMPEPVIGNGLDISEDLRALLDRELNRLPDKYRVPIVLCELEGRTRRAVSRQLGIPVGTLSGRLTTARRMLAKRLTRQGLALSCGALTAALSQGQASAAVPLPPPASMAAPRQIVAGVVSTRAAALADGVIKAMFMTNLKITAALFVMVGIIFAGGMLAHQPTAAQSPVESAKTITEGPQADKDAGPPKILNLGMGQRGRRVLWSPDGRTLVVVTKYESNLGRSGSAVKLWDVEKGELRQTVAEDAGPGLAFQHVIFSLDGKSIGASVSQEVNRGNSLAIVDVIKIWDAKTLALKQTLGGKSILACLALSADGKRVAAAGHGKKTVELWDVGRGALERTLATPEAQLAWMAFSPDEKALTGGSRKDDGSGELLVWNAETGELRSRRRLAKFGSTPALSANGKIFAGIGTGGEIVIWDAEKVERGISPPEPVHRGIAISVDGKTVAGACRDHKVRLWDLATGKLQETLEGHGAEIYSLAFSPDGSTLASTSQDETVRLWRLRQRVSDKK